LLDRVPNRRLADSNHLGDFAVGLALVNGLSPVGGRRFTLAHELGHHVFADQYSDAWILGTGGDDREKLHSVSQARGRLAGIMTRDGNHDFRATKLEWYRKTTMAASRRTGSGRVAGRGA
jgi:hypothetical protein